MRPTEPVPGRTNAVCHRPSKAAIVRPRRRDAPLDQCAATLFGGKASTLPMLKPAKHTAGRRTGSPNRLPTTFSIDVNDTRNRQERTSRAGNRASALGWHLPVPWAAVCTLGLHALVTEASGHESASCIRLPFARCEGRNRFKAALSPQPCRKQGWLQASAPPQGPARAAWNASRQARPSRHPQRCAQDADGPDPHAMSALT